MNNIDIANGLVFQEMDIGIGDFEKRLISQKKIYLLQELGLNLGYSYNWYVRGPYSPDLTAYLYNNIDVLSGYLFGDYTLSEIAKEKVEIINLMADEKPLDLSKGEWYELLASLLYIKKNWKLSRELSDTLLEVKPKYDRTQITKAYNALEKNGFVSEG